MARESETPTIIIDVAPGGVTTIEVSGVAGEGCKALTKPFEDILGPGAVDTAKPEMHQREQTSKARATARR